MEKIATGAIIFTCYVLVIYSYALGCKLMNNRNFVRREGKRAAWLLLAAWVILWQSSLVF